MAAGLHIEYTRKQGLPLIANGNIVELLRYLPYNH